MIRRRSIIALTILFGVVILILAYGGIESSRRNMLKLVRQEGESLMQALVTSVRNNLASSVIVEQTATERLIDVGNLLAALINQDRNYADSLDVWQRRYRLERVDIVAPNRRLIASAWQETVGDSLGGDSDRVAVLDSVMLNGRAQAVASPMPSALPVDDFTYLAIKTSPGVLLLQAKAKKITDYQRSLGIGFVLRQLGGQEAVDYVVLQSSAGIVLSSRNVQRMVAVEADTFLSNALADEQVASRLYEFEGKAVLEVVRAFKSDVMPSGLLRLGMSLDAYHQLYSDSLKQLVILSLVLFALGVVGSYAATSTKKLEATKGSLDQLKSLTDEIIQSLHAAVIATDRNGLVTTFNPQAEKLFGRSTSAVQGRPYRNAFEDDLLSLEKVRSTPGNTYRDEVVYQQSSGERRSLLVSSTPIYAEGGAYAGAVALVYDLTDYRRLEESARIAERLSELGTLAAGVAHEIRNPLNAISIATQRLRLEFQPESNVNEYHSFLKTISEEIDRLNLIVKDFLALARGGRIEKVLVDLRSFVDDIVALAKFESEAKNVAITVGIESGLLVNIDQMEMKKVFVNLIQNAVQSIEGPGTINITARKAHAGRTEIDLSNSGKPISSEARSRIFQPYFTTRQDGTGLGLTLCRRIVADHGGNIELLDGEPTTFRIVV
jgi:PAS domain S-box-containing protein